MTFRRLKQLPGHRKDCQSVSSEDCAANSCKSEPGTHICPRETPAHTPTPTHPPQHTHRQTHNHRRKELIRVLAYSGGTLPRNSKQGSLMKWRSLAGASEHEKKVIYLEKQDAEAFGFEIQTYGLHHRNENELEMCTFVCRVRENSPAELGGLKQGDTLTSINGVSVHGFRHRDIVELIKSSGDTLSLETVYGSSIRRAELETRLLYLKQTLQEKWEEYRSLMIQEQRLVHGIVSSDPSVYDTFESVRASVLSAGGPPCVGEGAAGAGGGGGGGGLGGGGRGGEGSGGGSYLDSVEDEEPIYQTCVFDSADSGSDGSEDRPPPRRRPLSRSASAKGGFPGVSPSPGQGQAVAGTIPRKSRRKSLRKRLLKFIPGLNQPVEEEESHL